MSFEPNGSEGIIFERALSVSSLSLSLEIRAKRIAGIKANTYVCIYLFMSSCTVFIYSIHFFLHSLHLLICFSITHQTNQQLTNSHLSSLPTCHFWCPFLLRLRTALLFPGSSFGELGLNPTPIARREARLNELMMGMCQIFMRFSMKCMSNILRKAPGDG